MSGNLGESSLRKRRRNVDPMAAFDGLPPPLRRWLAEAALPWSPTSAVRIWRKCRADGLTPDETLSSLSLIEARTLSRDSASIVVRR